MYNPPPTLPEQVNRFVASRLDGGDVTAVLLYGSYARGTEHEQSDVDIIFVVDQGFKSEVVDLDGVDVEVLEQTKHNMFAFWEQNLDEDRHWYLWKDVKVLYERNNEGTEVVAHAMSLVGEKRPWPNDRIEMRKKVAQAKLRRTRFLSQLDAGSAAIALVELVQAMTGHWFDVRGQRVPSSKAFSGVFAEEDPELGDLLVGFYVRPTEFDVRFDLADRMAELVYFPTPPPY